ncbi:hypothetical protein T459_16306 [Capsicum annuum]|uniref:Glycosyl transferase family 28 C-terminal domain-containing protein n=1 Tax=Capsicum annuum TaxID=4072 RepID=A0A2G2Z8F7_CAPAN|nr:hypothetical protein T459_16306 [Capsicum annuum]
MESLVKLHPWLYITMFLQLMDLAYAAPDLLVSGARAMICSEILAAWKPCIMIYSPDVAEGHQFYNACLMIDLADSRVMDEDKLDSLTLKNIIEEILADDVMFPKLKGASKSNGEQNRGSATFAKYWKDD